MKITLFCLCFLSVYFSFSQGIVIPFKEKNGQWSLVKKYSMVKVSEMFDDVQYIKNGVYQVTKKDLVGLYDTTGKILLPVKYKTLNTIVEYQDNMYPLIENDSVKFFDNNGILAFVWRQDSLPYSYTYYENGMLNTRKGFINKKGKLVLRNYDRSLWDDKYLLLQVGKVVKENDILWGVVNPAGKTIIQLNYHWIEIKDDHIIAGKGVAKDEVCYDLEGKMILNGHFTGLKLFPRAGLYSYEERDYITVLKDIKTGKRISNEYDDFQELTNGNVLVYKSGDDQLQKYFIIGKKGRVLNVMSRYQSLFECNALRGWFLYKDSLDRYGIVDSHENIVMKVPDSFYVILLYKEGLRIKNAVTGKEGIVDYTGKFLLQPEYDAVLYVEELKMWKVFNNGTYIYLDDRLNRYVNE